MLTMPPSWQKGLSALAALAGRSALPGAKLSRTGANAFTTSVGMEGGGGAACGSAGAAWGSGGGAGLAATTAGAAW